jgi:hypothetical protein
VIETALTIDAVKRAALTITGQEVDAQRYAETATMNGTEYGGWIDDRHFGNLQFDNLQFTICHAARVDAVIHLTGQPEEKHRCEESTDGVDEVMCLYIDRCTA